MTAELPDIESRETELLTCPHIRGIKGAHCVSGCWEEPACWDRPQQPRDRHGHAIPLTEEQLDAMAQKRWDDYRKPFTPIEGVTP